jgi:4'-phosphopantetheinyl transferase
VYETNGKPGLAGIEAASGLRFNASGSDGVGIVAVQLDAHVGVDVERVRPVPDMPSVAARVFAPEELAALGARPSNEHASAFFSIWTRKEAIVKCLGSGLSFPTRSFAVASPGAQIAERVMLETPGDPEGLWVRPLPDPRHGYLAALATTDDSTAVRCFRWPPPSEEGDEPAPGP